MFKRVVTFPLAEGRDPDEVWKYWIETHAVNFKKVPGIRKYVINRVIEPVNGMPFWGMAEFWFDSEEACKRAFNSARPKDDFNSMHGVSFKASVEEKVIV